ncbi:methenyltetrahydrofolate cyclohydrolase /5,10-methylenetetrahydrofolate dehydrogenase (NADP+) [Solirubrobacter pauli]|jgi:muconolactone delta-isomerase|uniref:Methenyltetrahydrofolate cyclohydrolase /5,10-methylenetetrahydrofolate dehydrogenase (NADP+) n=1 Tax=Solirubrobacter pauli TaxID=166793 RepID=A0A660L793_9ACTN|nr:muconolactone Delta-isomerase family protein [Solirubrobacter pauli]RKQ90256.1 methenyltetrahydrofolate cyclohydrolase /5,10-methylenetetrahydrofolate dehydrogenase (NADP+) [Solirubrobacter pauli]
MQFIVRFDVKQPANVSNEELIAIWRREAVAAQGAVDAGAVKHLWKVAGQRTVFAIIEVDSHETLDRALGGLPIIRELGPGVTTEALAIYDYSTYAQDLEEGVHGG